MKEQLKKEILKKVKEYYEQTHKTKRFVPGKDVIHYGGRVFDEKEMQAFVSSALDFWLTSGRETERFEKAFSSFLGAKEALLTNSGSSANLLAVSALCSPQMKDGLKPGDEVITPAVTFPTTLNPIIQNGLVPVFLDAGLETLNMETGLLEEAVSDKTRAMLIPHTLGNPNDMDLITKFAKANDLFLIEDACDALGSRWDGRLLGTFGHLSTFSFYPAHHITLGEGGAVATSDFNTAVIVRSLRDWGRACVCPVCKLNVDPDAKCDLRYDNNVKGLPDDYDRRYIYTNVGYNLKALDPQAAMGVEQLKKLPGFIKARKENFKRLYEAFSDYGDYFILPKALKKADPSWFAFPLTIRAESGLKRSEITSWYLEKKIEYRMLFAGNITRQPAYKDVKHRAVGDLKNSDYITENTFFLGIYPGIGREMLDYMVEKTREFMRKR
ncbi:MAG: lipopolysaccharide biosynthesis protein RfbH [Candidatus Altiarchaeota archaeon]|nr:lipopolysaccharide biosynthesis protein RfbH [Candidatus Altiarchaeota archaeon]